MHARTADGVIRREVKPVTDRRHRVVFNPAGLEALAEEGETVLNVAQRSGVDLDSVCGGRGVCGRCQFAPTSGDFAKWSLSSTITSLNRPTEAETQYHGRRPLSEDSRLGCQARVRGPLVIDVPPESQVHAPIVRKEIALQELTLDSASVLRVVHLDLSQVKEALRTEKVLEALDEAWQIVPIEVRPEVEQALAGSDAEMCESFTLHLRRKENGEVLHSVRYGTSVENLGVAIDIGSTTVAGHLLDLGDGEILASEGAMNLQIRLGEDLMSRVSYVMMNPQGGSQLKELARESVLSLIRKLGATAECDLSNITEIVLVGNPIMHHSFLGFDVVPLGQMPFDLATDEAVQIPAEEVGIPIPAASVYFAPCIAGHVGADSAAALLSEKTHQTTSRQLLVDIGTNAEIMFKGAGGVVAASSPTGPAFEGAQITHGQRATVGAIERVRIDRDTFEPSFKVIGCESWSNEPAFNFGQADSLITGICGSGIIEVVGEMYLSGLVGKDGTILDNRQRTRRVIPNDRTFSYVLCEQSDDSAALNIVITQNDIRAIQLAKAALRAGIDLLLERCGESHADEIRLAGAFGAQIDPLYAMVLGLIPDCQVGQVRGVGNAAGSGAVRMLLSLKERIEVEALVRDVQRVETATEPRFQELFVGAMAFPHATASTPNLADAVALPSHPLTSAYTSTRPRRRGRRKDAVNE